VTSSRTSAKPAALNTSSIATPRSASIEAIVGIWRNVNSG
jgi:hypothetical protein